MTAMNNREAGSGRSSYEFGSIVIDGGGKARPIDTNYSMNLTDFSRSSVQIGWKPVSSSRAIGVSSKLPPAKQFYERPGTSSLVNQSLDDKLSELFHRIEQNQLRVSRLERNSQSKQNNLDQKISEHLSRINQNINPRMSLQMQSALAAVETDLAKLQMDMESNKQLEGIIAYGFNMSNAKINQLNAKFNGFNQEINQIKSKLNCLLPRVESELVAVGQRYEAFIESTIIKTVENINKMGLNWESQFAKIKTDLTKFDQQLQSFLVIKGQPLVANREEYSKIPCPKYRIIDNLTLLSKFVMVGSHQQLELVQTTYKIDTDGNLLDHEQNYLLDENGTVIRLSSQTMELLRKNQMM